MRLYVPHPDTGGATEGIERTKLVQRVRADLIGRAGDLATAKTHQVGKPGVRADRHTVALTSPDCALQRARIAAVESAGDVRARQHRKEIVVVADPPSAEAFAEIAVQIDGRHRRTPCGDMAPIAHRHHRTTRRKPCRLVILSRELTYRDPRDPTNTRSAHGRGDDASDDRLHFPAHETPTSA